MNINQIASFLRKQSEGKSQHIKELYFLSIQLLELPEIQLALNHIPLHELCVTGRFAKGITSCANMDRTLPNKIRVMIDFINKCSNDDVCPAIPVHASLQYIPLSSQRLALRSESGEFFKEYRSRDQGVQSHLENQLDNDKRVTYTILDTLNLMSGKYATDHLWIGNSEFIPYCIRDGNVFRVTGENFPWKVFFVGEDRWRKIKIDTPSDRVTNLSGGFRMIETEIIQIMWYEMSLGQLLPRTSASLFSEPLVECKFEHTANPFDFEMNIVLKGEPKAHYLDKQTYGNLYYTAEERPFCPKCERPVADETISGLTCPNCD